MIESLSIPAETTSSTPHIAISTSSSLHFKTFREIMAEPVKEIAYCVDGLIPMGGLSLLAGKPKAGKSTLVRQLAASVANGTDFLSRLTIQGSVLYLALEEMQSEVNKHLEDLGVNENSPVSLHFGGSGKPEQAIGEIQSVIQKRGDIALVIIDPLVNFLKVRDGNDYSLMYPAMMKLVDLARNTGVAIVVVHHAKKRKSDDLTDGALGSTAITGAADNIVVIESHGETRSISTQQRYGRSLEPTQLRWDAESRRMELGQTAQAIEENSRAATQGKIKDAIVNFVRLYPGCCTQEQILTAVTGNASQKMASLNVLTVAGSVHRSGSGHRGDPFTYRVGELTQTETV